MAINLVSLVMQFLTPDMIGGALRLRLALTALSPKGPSPPQYPQSWPG